MKRMEKTMKHLSKWWRVSLLLFVCLFGGSSGDYAMRIITTDYYQGWGYMSYIDNQPTIDNPYIGIDLVYYEGEGEDTYFTHTATEDGKAGPALYVDGKYICSPDNELGWKNNYKDAEKACGDDDWWGNTYSKDGIVVKFWNPYHMTDHYWVNRVSMRVYLPNWKIGESHTIKLKGHWKQENKTEKLVEKSWTTNPFPDPFPAASPTAVMTNYNTVSVSGQLNKNYQMFVGLAPDKTAAPSDYVEIGSANSHEYFQQSSFSGITTTLSWGSNYKDPRKLPIQYSVRRYSDADRIEHIYKWYEVSVPGFAYANVNNNVTTDMWNKKVTLSWTAVDGNNRCKNGKWKLKNETTGELIPAGDTKIDYGSNTRTYTITVPKYDTDYNIGVYFVPDGMTSLNSSLCVTKKVRIDRNFSFSNLKATDNLDNGIKVSWSHTPFGDASSTKRYTISLQRTENASDSTSWVTIKEIVIENPSTSNGEYMDDNNGKGLAAQTTYFYRLRVVALDNVLYPSATVSGCLGGMTTVTELKASQGLYNNMVKLNWKVDQVGTNTTYFTVSRRLLGSKKETDWIELGTLSGVGASYSYDDMTVQLGMYYEYRVATSIIKKVNGKDVVKPGMMITTDGFAMSSGTVSGRITYGTGTAVPGAKVVLESNEVGFSGLRSLELSGVGTDVGLFTDLTPATIQELFEKDFSIQMYINPDSAKMNTDKLRYIVLDVPEVFHIALDYEASTGRYKLGAWIADRGYTNLYIPACQWSHVTLVHKHNLGTTTFHVAAADTLRSAQVQTTTAEVWTDRPIVWSTSALQATTIALGNYGSPRPPQGNNFQGLIDEFRFFTDTLSVEDIKNNYNHPLVGNEKGLAIYYPFDEGMESQTKVYDFSKTNGVMNCRYAKAKVAAKSSENISEELGMFSFTDKQGNYTVRGVPFAGDGTSYLVTPEMGIHEFSPAYKTVYVSGSSLVHSGVDFDDVSSFPVSGKVYYANTDYPVKGVKFYVDGIICSKDGEHVTSAADGSYTISVPIGSHFIQAKLEGHEFENEGRYPADPGGTGERINFNKAIPDLEFHDITLVNFTGRVVGGDIEGDKPIGFGASVNNIGKAKLVLQPQNADMYRMNVVPDTPQGYKNNPDSLIVPSDTVTINSFSYRGGGNKCNTIFIETDPATGEFSALLPPLSYTLQSISINKGAMNLLGTTTKTIDLTQPLVSYTDSIERKDSTWAYYDYNTLLRYTYHSDPTFTVKQKGNDDGAFGIKEYTVKKNGQDYTIDDIYTIDDAGKITYNYGGAVFIEMDTYEFDIEGYEEYTNYDDPTVEPSRVPLADVVVQISNALSTDQAVYGEGNTAGLDPGSVDEDDMEKNTITLDEKGKGTYRWKAGLPNITYPYSRTLNIKYEIANHGNDWSGNPLYGVVLGSLPTGNNFVTAGPDQLDMILRDPPGTGSSAEWTSGTSFSQSHSEGGTWSSETEVKTTSHLGPKTSMGAGIGVWMITEVENRADLEVGVKVTTEGEDASTWNREVTITKTITTSDAMEYVGAQGDVFVGASTNIIYGMARNIDFYPNTDETTGKKGKLQKNDIVTTGLDFETEFAYTQNYIENVLIPNFEKMRNSKLKPNSTIGTTNSNPGKYPIYLTTLSDDDERFGSSNHDKTVWGNLATAEPSAKGPSYTMVRPDNADADVSFQDSVEWCNNQIAIWKKYLALNEKEKVEAYNKRGKNVKNYSFDSGTTVTNSVEKSYSTGNTYDINVSSVAILGTKFGAKFNGIGVEWEIGTETGGGWHKQTEETTTTTESFSYTLAEDGDDDAISVDVYEYGDFGPIFRTRGGQTCAPYEGEVRTKYYEPGQHVIMEATMQIEVPDIDVEKDWMSDVPTGGIANYTLLLRNASQIDEDVYYRLLVADETNPDGAIISIDGKVITDNRIIKIPAGQTVTKLMQLKQADASILKYYGCKDENDPLYNKGIAIVLASQSQYDPTSTWEVIADTVFIKAEFVPSSSDVTLELSNSTMNTNTGTALELTLKDFDRNYHGLKAFRLQQKKKGNSSWEQFHEYLLTGSQLNSDQEILPSTGASVKYTLEMEPYADGEYLFRVASVSMNGYDEIFKYSDELALVKDMQSARPLGQPEPTDGILSAGEDVSVTFNENILRGELTDAKNFRVTGVLNGAAVAHETALSMTGTKAAASTEARITLAGKNFSIDTWMNLKGAGTFLSHGSGATKFTIGTNENRELVVNIAGNTYTSNNKTNNAFVPYNTWAFLSVSYEMTDEGGKLNASVASGSETVVLFEDEEVVSYSGNGTLSVGQMSNGSAMHELLLWDEARSMTTALADRSVTKNPSTRHLIGYWKMDEGEGTTIRDYARSRNMTMPEETWALDNENKSLELNGSKYLSINTASLPKNNIYDDYALEFWMRGAAQGEAQLLQMGDISLWLDSKGKLKLTSKGETIDASKKALTDNNWHHVALNVLRLGAAAVYVDGERQLTAKSDNVGAIAGAELLLGASKTGNTYGKFFTGQIDELRVWNASVTADEMLKSRKVRLTGEEDGLSVYYPFEKKVKDEYNMYVTEGVCENMISKPAAFTNNPNDFAGSYSDVAPALRTKPIETGVGFNFTASDNKVVINITEDAATIEGCTLNFSLINVRDENGNYSDPVKWSAFVNRNELVWAEDELTVTQPVETSSSVTATIVNKGGKQQTWTLSGMPSWLQASTEYGTTNPNAESQVTFTVTSATPIGKYEETIYLKGNDEIETPLTINVKVTGDEPMWSVNVGDYEDPMNVIANLYILDILSEDEDDMVGAFIDGECRGVARPEYNVKYDSYFVTMNVYGNGKDADKPVEFKAYDASTGIIYPVVKAYSFTTATTNPELLDVIYDTSDLVGRYNAPVMLTATDEVEQNIELGKGWNWMSLGVKPDDFTVENVFSKANGKVEFVKNIGKSTGLEDGEWIGTLTKMNNKELYVLQASEPLTLSVTGHRVKSNEEKISVKSGWTWVAFNSLSVMSLDIALAGMQPKDDEIIKGQRGVAYFDGYEWLGNLKQLTPGQGYKIKGKSPRTFTYPVKTATAGARMATVPEESASGALNAQPSMFTPVDYHLYPGNMVLVAQVVADGQPVEGVELGIFADEECREAAVSDGRGMIITTIPGDKPCELTFRVSDGSSQPTMLNTQLTYENDAVVGTPKAPFIIDLGEATGIVQFVATESQQAGQVYDMQGRKVDLNDQGRKLRKGVYVVNGQKQVK